MLSVEINQWSWYDNEERSARGRLFVLRFSKNNETAFSGKISTRNLYIYLLHWNRKKSMVNQTDVVRQGTQGKIILKYVFF